MNLSNFTPEALARISARRSINCRSAILKANANRRKIMREDERASLEAQRQERDRIKQERLQVRQQGEAQRAINRARRDEIIKSRLLAKEVPRPRIAVYRPAFVHKKPEPVAEVVLPAAPMVHPEPRPIAPVVAFKPMLPRQVGLSVNRDGKLPEWWKQLEEDARACPGDRGRP